jgi:predicted secreted protein
MKILKVIAIFFVIYFIRRFIQLYRAMKKIQEAQANGQTFHKQSPQTTPEGNIINADFKVVD